MYVLSISIYISNTNLKLCKQIYITLSHNNAFSLLHFLPHWIVLPHSQDKEKFKSNEKLARITTELQIGKISRQNNDVTQ